MEFPSVTLSADPGPIPILPVDVLALAMQKLGDDVQDLSRTAQVCREWRAEVYACEPCWERAFLRDFGDLVAADFAAEERATPRDKYIAAAMASTCHKLRSKARQFDEIEDAGAALERQQQHLLVEMESAEASLASSRAELSAALAEAAGDEAALMTSKMGCMLLEATEEGKAQGGLLSADARQKLAAAAALHAAAAVGVQARHEALRKLVDAQSYNAACSRRLAAAVAGLRAKRDSLALATAWRPAR